MCDNKLQCVTVCLFPGFDTAAARDRDKYLFAGDVLQSVAMCCIELQ